MLLKVWLDEYHYPLVSDSWGPFFCLISLNYSAAFPKKHRSYKSPQSRFCIIHSLLILAWSSVMCDKIYREICEISVIGIRVRPKTFPVSGSSTIVYLSQHSLGFKTIVKQAGTAVNGRLCRTDGYSTGSQETVHEHCVFVGAWAPARNVYKESALSFLVQD